MTGSVPFCPLMFSCVDRRHKRIEMYAASNDNALVWTGPTCNNDRKDVLVLKSISILYICIKIGSLRVCFPYSDKLLKELETQVF